LNLLEEVARDAEVVGEADAVVDGDRRRARLDVDGVAPGWLRRAHVLCSPVRSPSFAGAASSWRRRVCKGYSL
jgi:hypothetical protein